MAHRFNKLRPNLQRRRSRLNLLRLSLAENTPHCRDLWLKLPSKGDVPLTCLNTRGYPWGILRVSMEQLQLQELPQKLPIPLLDASRSQGIWGELSVKGPACNLIIQYYIRLATCLSIYFTNQSTLSQPIYTNLIMFSPSPCHRDRSPAFATFFRRHDFFQGFWRVTAGQTAQKSSKRPRCVGRLIQIQSNVFWGGYVSKIV